MKTQQFVCLASLLIFVQVGSNAHAKGRRAAVSAYCRGALSDGQRALGYTGAAVRVTLFGEARVSLKPIASDYNVSYGASDILKFPLSIRARPIFNKVIFRQHVPLRFFATDWRQKCIYAAALQNSSADVRSLNLRAKAVQLLERMRPDLAADPGVWAFEPPYPVILFRRTSAWPATYKPNTVVFIKNNFVVAHFDRSATEADAKLCR